MINFPVVLLDAAGLRSHLPDFLRYDVLAFDTETFYNPNNQQAIVRWIKGNPTNEPFLLTISDGQTGWAVYFSDETRPLVAELLAAPGLTKVFYNAKYDIHMLRNIGIDVAPPVVDVMVMRHLLDENSDVRDLKGNAVKYIDPDADYWERAVDEERARIAKERKVPKDAVSYQDVPADVMIRYATADTLYTYRLYQRWSPSIQEMDLMSLLDTEMRCLMSIVEIERTGMRVDLEYLRNLDMEISAKLEELEKALVATARQYGLTEFNPNSANDIVAVYTAMGVNYYYKTDKGAWRTDSDTLTTYLRHCGVLAAETFTERLLEFRNEEKILNTFVRGLLSYVQEDGRVHPEFWQTGTRTGRMSSSNPNFQNFPKGDDRIRRAFIPSDGYVFVYMDYAQQEYKLLAHYAQDAALINAIKQGWDVHAATGCLFAGITMEEWSRLPEKEAKAIRQRGKTANFAIVYGLGNAALANQLGFPINEPLVKKANAVFRALRLKPWDLPPVEEVLRRCGTEEDREAVRYYYSEECQQALSQAQQFKQEYFGRFPGIQVLSKDVAAVAKRRGYVFNWAKRRRRLLPDESYKALNALIQGGCGDILKDRLWRVQEFLKDTRSRIVNLVHDEVQFEIHKSEFTVEFIKRLKSILDDLPFRVPITTDVEWSNTNWAEKRDIKEGLGEDVEL